MLVRDVLGASESSGPGCEGIAAAAREMRDAYLAACVGEVYPVLYEQSADGLCRGHAPNYAGVAVRGEGLHNQVRLTRAVSAGGGILLGELCGE